MKWIRFWSQFYQWFQSGFFNSNIFIYLTHVSLQWLTSFFFSHNFYFNLVSAAWFDDTVREACATKLSLVIIVRWHCSSRVFRKRSGVQKWYNRLHFYSSWIGSLNVFTFIHDFKSRRQLYKHNLTEHKANSIRKKSTKTLCFKEFRWLRPFPFA